MAFPSLISYYHHFLDHSYHNYGIYFKTVIVSYTSIISAFPSYFAFLHHSDTFLLYFTFSLIITTPLLSFPLLYYQFPYYCHCFLHKYHIIYIILVVTDVDISYTISIIFLIILITIVIISIIAFILLSLNHFFTFSFITVIISFIIVIISFLISSSFITTICFNHQISIIVVILSLLLSLF